MNKIVIKPTDTLINNSSGVSYLDYEGDLLYGIMEALECGHSDAEGFAGARSSIVTSCWEANTPIDDAVKTLLN